LGKATNAQFIVVQKMELKISFSGLTNEPFCMNKHRRLHTGEQNVCTAQNGKTALAGQLQKVEKATNGQKYSADCNCNDSKANARVRTKQIGKIVDKCDAKSQGEAQNPVGMNSDSRYGFG
jgi:hypothetical protein